ncbi:hypothetical protein IQ215_00880 [Cyanobacterium stanieri LEGE 03274]|uniref:SRPBCC domain-containing protein n=1 Tax=Cyanobacterium stanieri LEGE 03274 TaxID=1828756 RepID=A0ABR9V033_9CHRO|nr:hypothetical protein [Cyanobacterium stanieri]MBE9221240.1 hypothetical protein [Cyanobacterium stanieri LEGE 03274]
MLGKFQSSQLRIEIEAGENILRQSILEVDSLKRWFFPLGLDKQLSSSLTKGARFKAYVGLAEINHEVKCIENNCICFILSGAIDGYQEWCWGDGWVQSSLEGVSLLPLKLGHSFNLFKFREFVGYKVRQLKSED